jgi:hypothetical protein
MNRHFKHVVYRLAMFCAFIVMGVLAANWNSTASEFTTKSLRTVTMVDAYERFSESGRPSWKGIFIDDKLGTKFEWDVEPRTFRQFIADETPRSMQVTASREEVGDPDTPDGVIFLSSFFILTAFIGLIWQLIGFLFFWPSKYDY